MRRDDAYVRPIFFYKQRLSRKFFLYNAWNDEETTTSVFLLFIPRSIQNQLIVHLIYLHTFHPL